MKKLTRFLYGSSHLVELQEAAMCRLKVSHARRRSLTVAPIIKHDTFYYGVAIFASFIYAVYLVVNKNFLLGDISPLMFACGSSLFSALFALLSICLSRHSDDTWSIAKSFWAWIILYGIIAGVLARTFLFFGQSHVTATNTGFILAGSRPFFALALGYLLMREVVTRKHVITIIAMIVGAFILSSGSEMVFHTGDLLVVLCGMVLGTGHALSRRLSVGGIRPLVLTFCEMLISAIGLFIIVTLTSPTAVSFEGWWAWLLSGLCIFLAVFARNLALSRIPATIISSLR